MVKIREDSFVGVTLQRGREEGREEGRNEGKLEALQSMLKTLLASKFGVLPQSIADSINQCKQLDRLEGALVRIFQLNSLKELAL